MFAWFQCFVCFERPSRFGHTHTCINIGAVFGLFHKSVCIGVIDLVSATSRPLLVCMFVVNTGCSGFAPRQKRMFWGHLLKERGIVIFVWFQCFVYFERPHAYRTRTCHQLWTGQSHASVGSSAPRVLGILVLVLALCYTYFFYSSVLTNAIFGLTSLLYGSCIQLSNSTDRTSRQRSFEHDGP